MRLHVVALLAGLATMAHAAGQQKNTTQFDGFDLDSILYNDRLLKSYLDCLLKDNARCSPDAKTLKEFIRDALPNDCAECSPRQKEVFRTFINFLLTNYPDVLKQLMAKNTRLQEPLQPPSPPTDLPPTTVP
ncbi:ejaculatory bulb-specific protein 3-like [Bacillus rossius redtenbacheri]|uniref:ejaculatory bulb-specific protein 3-like n=1 Tax=Bacillus rossius redtenbacheri TaxID=93214 RepID=UPI002FDC9A64